jgi:sn-glycerol 3-phosphate transport system ATP-binding protein
MPDISLDHVSKVWTGKPAVDDVSFTARDKQLVVLLGPSGCGKSTLLRLIAGLEAPSRGRIAIGGRDVTGLPPSQRRIAMVFQSYALFPHLNVAENIVFGLKARGLGRAEREKRLARAASLVGLSELLARKPAQLSGGQRQRVALGRAIVAESPVCLMDEPLSNLDAQLRHEMRGEIRSLQQRLDMTMIYVTHDQHEAMSMADEIVLMRDGRIEQAATPAVIYQRPATAFAARFLGTPPMNLIPVGAIELARAVTGGAHGLPARDGLLIGVRPEHIAILRDGAGQPVALGAVEYLGAESVVQVWAGDAEILVRVPGRFEAESGMRLGLSWPAHETQLFAAEDGRRIGGLTSAK